MTKPPSHPFDQAKGARTLDTKTALDAANEWRTIAELLPTIRLYLEPQRSRSETHSPPASKPPMRIAASDILLEIETAADFYCRVLADETHDFRIPATMDERVFATSERHGHFTMATDRTALDYADEAHQLLDKIGVLIQAPEPPQWLGPCCVTPGCTGELFAKDVHTPPLCNRCGSLVDPGVWRAHLQSRLTSWLISRAEILPALRMMGAHVSESTLRTWIHRRRLVPVIVEPERFRFTDAATLARLKLAGVAA